VQKAAPLWLALLGGCTGPTTGADVAPPIAANASAPSCTDGETYASPVVEPMTLGEILFPHSWPVAIHRGTGLSTALHLANVPCARDAEIDWSPFDVLLFVSIPAW
jgi:hypothetical protein